MRPLPHVWYAIAHTRTHTHTSFEFFEATTQTARVGASKRPYAQSQTGVRCMQQSAVDVEELCAIYLLLSSVSAAPFAPIGRCTEFLPGIDGGTRPSRQAGHCRPQHSARQVNLVGAWSFSPFDAMITADFPTYQLKYCPCLN